MRQKCAVCYKSIDPTCNWNQGRCPHTKSVLQSVIDDPYKSRFYNLLKFLKVIK